MDVAKLKDSLKEIYELVKTDSDLHYHLLYPEQKEKRIEATKICVKTFNQLVTELLDCSVLSDEPLDTVAKQVNWVASIMNHGMYGPYDLDSSVAVKEIPKILQELNND